MSRGGKRSRGGIQMSRGGILTKRGDCLMSQEDSMNQEGKIECQRKNNFEADLIKQLQRKMSGFIMKQIWRVQAFVKEFCMAKANNTTGKCRMQRNTKQWVVELQTKCQAWFKAALKIINIPGVGTLKRWIEQAPQVQTNDTRPIVYVRFNLKTKDLYIGETEHWHDRVATHFVKTCTHTRECNNPCKGCTEHIRYLKHRCAEPHEWCMIPIAIVQYKYEARRLEKQLIRRYDPKINMEESERRKKYMDMTYKRKEKWKTNIDAVMKKKMLR